MVFLLHDLPMFLGVQTISLCFRFSSTPMLISFVLAQCERERERFNSMHFPHHFIDRRLNIRKCFRAQKHNKRICNEHQIFGRLNRKHTRFIRWRERGWGNGWSNNNNINRIIEKSLEMVFGSRPTPNQVSAVLH